MESGLKDTLALIVSSELQAFSIYRDADVHAGPTSKLTMYWYERLTLYRCAITKRVDISDLYNWT